MKAIKGFVLFSFLFAFGFAHEPGQPSKPGDTIVHLQTVLRHGDRAAQADDYITDQAAQIYFRGKGELSDQGLAHARSIGEQFRDVYIDKAQFLDVRMLPSQVRFRASAVDRTLMTSTAFSSGLFRSNSSAVPAPVYTEAYATDSLLAIQTSCYDGWLDVVSDFGLSSTDDITTQLLEAMRATSWECADPPARQSDTLISENADPITRAALNEHQIACANDFALRFMFDYVLRLSGSGSNYTRSLHRLQRTVGSLSFEIMSKFKERAKCIDSDGSECGSTQIALFYGAHDVNLVGIMNTFSFQRGAEDFLQGRSVGFGASLSMELWRRDEETYYIKMYYKNGADSNFTHFDYCGYIPDDFEKTDDGLCTMATLDLAKNVSLGLRDGEPLDTTCVTNIDSCCRTGIWSEWSDSGVCAQPCGGCSNSTRTRVCTSLDEGCPCLGDATDVGPCNRTPCRPGTPIDNGCCFNPFDIPPMMYHPKQCGDPPYPDTKPTKCLNATSLWPTEWPQWPQWPQWPPM